MTTILADVDMIDTMLQKLFHFNPLKRSAAEGDIVLTEEEIFFVIDRIVQEFNQQSALVETQAPLTICGDTHGQYSDLLSLFKHCGWPPKMRYLFLGDYVDRGRHSIETICLILLFRLRYPDKFYVLRGNHETANINRVYGFYDECKRRYSVRLWAHFQLAFNSLPIAGLVSSRIFCMHGGLSPELHTLNQIRNMTLPFQAPDFGGLIADLLWSDPSKAVAGYQASTRGISYVFGEDVVNEFTEKHSIDLICRAHQVVHDGYEFFANRKLITIFSAPNYCGEFDNCAGMLYVNSGLHCKIRQLKPTRPSYPPKRNKQNRIQIQ